jgi:AraC-like DNA-binding protein
MMRQSDDFPGTPQSGYEPWRALLRSICGRNNPEGIEPTAFSGLARPLSVCGFAALDLGCNAPPVERTYRDVRLDSLEHYKAVFQLAGQSTMIQNDQAVQLAVGDIALVDAARPVTYVSDDRNAQWLCLYLPRRSLVSHLGFEPRESCRRGGTLPGRLLYEVVLDALKAGGSPDDTYMQLAVYDLLGALFAPSDPRPVSRPTDKLFTRIRSVIKDRCADPDFGPCEVAAETGISLRYVQKLFTARGSTCSEFIYSLRLDHAARLLHRRAFLGMSEPLSAIAYACGFRDYAHFARKFRHRFGYPPGAHSEAQGHSSDSRSSTQATKLPRCGTESLLF